MKSINRYRLLIVIIGALSFIPFLGLTHLFDWDEINFAEAAREMIVSGNYSMVTIDFQPFWEKPPFFIWLQALSMKAFGVNEFAARLPNAICGAASQHDRHQRSPNSCCTGGVTSTVLFCPSQWRTRSKLMDTSRSLLTFGIGSYTPSCSITGPARS